MQLDLNSLSATDNDTGSNWCPSEQEFGTPGAANLVCPATCDASFGSHDAVCDASNDDVPETIIAVWDFNNNQATIDANPDFVGAGVTNQTINWLVTNQADETGTGHDNEITVTNRNGFSGDFLQGLALDPSNLVDGLSLIHI